MSAPFLLRLLPARARLLLHALLIAAAVVLACGLLPSGTASAAAPAIDVCNGTDNVGGEEVRCEVTITNSLDLATGVGSSTVTVQECHGAAGAPTCSAPTTTSFNDVTTSVTLCDGSGSGGGGVVACTVRISNTITGSATTTPATINQCNGSGGGGGTEPTVQCSPVGSTTGATVTQCNSAGNGGGATLRVRCTVDSSTQTGALPVSISQCNGSGNGGGGTVTCRSSVTNDVRAAQAAPVPSATPAPSASPAASPAPSATPAASPAPVSASPAAASPSAAPASPGAVPAPTSSATPAAPAPGTVEPAPTSSPAAPVVAAPVVGAPLAGAPISGGPVAAPAGNLPPAVLPVEAPLASATGGSAALAGSATLPRTGGDASEVALLGLLLTVGGSFLLLVGRTPRPIGRHQRPSR